MLKVQFPSPNFQIRNSRGSDEIFDGLRKKWIVLTPEEWVRQNFIRWLVEVQQIPEAFIAVEKLLEIGDKLRRFDILVYDRHYKPWFLVECKAMEVSLSEKVLQQTLSMFSVLPAQIIAITNGHYTYAWQASNGGYDLLEVLPGFPGA